MLHVKDLSWEPLRLEWVCEVKYDHLQGDRFRHATQFLRWRPDKSPADCRYDKSLRDCREDKWIGTAFATTGHYRHEDVPYGRSNPTRRLRRRRFAVEY